MKVYVAKTHPSEYLIHKYWARKPHNVVASFIKKYALENAYVLDPFCGSCVTNIESAKLGINSIGIDINPISGLIGNVSTTKVIMSKIIDEHENLKNLFKEYAQPYETEHGMVKYCVHEVCLKCQKCENVYSIKGVKKKGKKYICPQCSTANNANLGTISGSDVIKVLLTSKLDINNKKNIEQQTVQANKKDEIGQIYDVRFIVNKRILSYQDTTLRKFYTPRAYTVLSKMANKIHAIKDETIRNIFLLNLTATATQCSRLIAYRNDLTTGGPAWSVPGFWIPAIHLETNPFVAFESRFKKTMDALARINVLLKEGTKTYIYSDGIDAVGERISEKKIGYIFADPPYGDSVPYLEFSAIWNAWLKKEPNYKKEIVVSDSKTRNKSWDIYKNELVDGIKKAVNSLCFNGCVTFTFNHLVIDAWHSLLLASEQASLNFEDICLTLPAVIPAKARFSPQGSYLGDFYVTFKKVSECQRNKLSQKEFNDLLKEMFGNMAGAREGVIYKPHAIRVIVGVVLKKQLSCDHLYYAEEFLKENFNELKEARLLYLPTYEKTTPVQNDIEAIVKDRLQKGSCDGWEIVKNVLDNYDFSRAPEIVEILDVLKNVAEKKGKLYQLRADNQLSLFSINS
ncbi:MAG TPA: DNA methyltransferase [Candidatus Omnitrophota bacterium]|nr:DNA methyltransferase [Candidatus Omnitrophota bacterium]HPS19725.1 DNA methyltransferase [Candidatus Omnitrophota bacterium]